MLTPGPLKQKKTRKMSFPYGLSTKVSQKGYGFARTIRQCLACGDQLSILIRDLDIKAGRLFGPADLPGFGP